MTKRTKRFRTTERKTCRTSSRQAFFGLLVALEMCFGCWASLSLGWSEANRSRNDRSFQSLAFEREKSSIQQLMVAGILAQFLDSNDKASQGQRRWLHWNVYVHSQSIENNDQVVTRFSKGGAFEAIITAANHTWRCQAGKRQSDGFSLECIALSASQLLVPEEQGQLV